MKKMRVIKGINGVKGMKTHPHSSIFIPFILMLLSGCANFPDPQPAKSKPSATQSNQSVNELIERAAILRKQGKPKEALLVMQEAQSREADNAEVIAHLGYALIANGQNKETVTLFDTLILKDPANVAAYNGKAVAYDKSGNHLAAQELYERALLYSPDSVSIQNNLAMSFILNNQLSQAESLLEKLHLKAPNNRTVQQNLALVYGVNGKSDKALELNQLSLSPEEAKANLVFYEQYASKRNNQKPASVEPQVGFKSSN
jgi:Flp pilus assembly protein TadD